MTLSPVAIHPRGVGAAVGGKQPTLVQTPATPQGVKTGTHGFGAVLDRLSSSPSFGIDKDFRALRSFEGAIAHKNSFSLKELLAFQVKASRFHLRVEAYAKVADAAVSSVKRFQSMR